MIDGKRLPGRGHRGRRRSRGDAPGATALVAIMGKGHETGQEIGGEVHPSTTGPKPPVRWRPPPRNWGGVGVIPVTLAQIAALTGGVVVGTDDPTLSWSPVTSSPIPGRPGGALYVARIGEHADGHAFIPSALANGAVAALVSRVAPDEVPQVVVDDVQAAFASLARWVIDTHSDLLVVGITGSSGKTSTKDLLGEVLRVTGPTIAPEGSFNSEVGVP